MIAKVTKVWRNTGNSGKVYFTVQFDNGIKASTFDNNIQAAEGKVIEFSTTQKGNYTNLDPNWAYADVQGAGQPAQQQQEYSPPTQQGTNREDMILRQSSLKAAIEVAGIAVSADKISLGTKKDPVVLEEYVKDLSVRLFHWAKDDSAWELSDADAFLNNEDKGE